MSKENYYDIVLSPVITEKSTLMADQNKVMFNVARNATKPQIKAAVEALFGGQHPGAQGQGEALPQHDRPAVRCEEGRRDAGRGPDHRCDRRSVRNRSEAVEQWH